jgi:hypothetical protein
MAVGADVKPELSCLNNHLLLFLVLAVKKESLKESPSTSQKSSFSFIDYVLKINSPRKSKQTSPPSTKITNH